MHDSFGNTKKWLFYIYSSESIYILTYPAKCFVHVSYILTILSHYKGGNHKNNIIIPSKLISIYFNKNNN